MKEVLDSCQQSSQSQSKIKPFLPFFSVLRMKEFMDLETTNMNRSLGNWFTNIHSLGCSRFVKKKKRQLLMSGAERTARKEEFVGT
jgi:hypothetical protein